MILADTSVWIDFARRGDRGPAANLRAMLRSGDVATCGPVVSEILAGADGHVAEKMKATLLALPWAGLDREGWCEVGALANRLRRDGAPLPLTDLVIGMSASRAGHALWSFDSHFDRIAATLTSLELHQAT